MHTINRVSIALLLCSLSYSYGDHVETVEPLEQALADSVSELAVKALPIEKEAPKSCCRTE